jgi:PAP2 superfamily
VRLRTAVVAPAAAADPPLGPDTYVPAWDATASQAFSAAALTPAEGHTIFAYVGIAVYDAVMAVHPQYQPFMVDADAPAGTSAEAAVAAAAHPVLVHYLPGQKESILDPAYASSLATIADGQAKADGVALGESVAAALIAERTGDGFRAPATYTPDPDNPAAWMPTSTAPPIGPYLGLMRPFALSSADQFRPAGPPALGTKKWARDYTEVKDIGSFGSTTRTPEQTVAARFWAEPPVQQARGSFRHFVTQRGLDIVQAARFMGMVSVTYADALIACFDAKYHYAFWRPVTAIRAGHTDGNDATVADPTWTPLLGTPNHPEYPSAHSCITPAGGIVIARFLGTGQIDFTVPSLTGLGDRHFARAKDLEHDVSNARIWGGIHYRSAVEDGAVIAKKTAHHVLAHYFRAVNG